MKKDWYDDAVAYYQKHIDQCKEAWVKPREVPYGLLFGFLNDGRASYLGAGCPSQVMGGDDAQTPELTKAIRAIEGLPPVIDDNEPEFTKENLHTFAIAQRIADKMLNRTPPERKNAE